MGRGQKAENHKHSATLALFSRCVCSRWQAIALVSSFNLHTSLLSLHSPTIAHHSHLTPQPYHHTSVCIHTTTSLSTTISHFLTHPPSPLPLPLSPRHPAAPMRCCIFKIRCLRMAKDLNFSLRLYPCGWRHTLPLSLLHLGRSFLWTVVICLSKLCGRRDVQWRASTRKQNTAKDHPVLHAVWKTFIWGLNEMNSSDISVGWGTLVENVQHSQHVIVWV